MPGAPAHGTSRSPFGSLMENGPLGPAPGRQEPAAPRVPRATTTGIRAPRAAPAPSRLTPIPIWSGPMANLKRVLWHLLGGTRGGPLRIRIIHLLSETPLNTNQVATELGIDYKTAQHHLRVLTENRIAAPTGNGYGAVYLLTKDMEESRETFSDISRRVLERQAKRALKAARKDTDRSPTQ